MARIHCGRAYENIGALQCITESLGLARGINNVVARAPGHEEGNLCGLLRDVIDGRGLVIAEAIFQRTEAEEDLTQIALWREQMVKLPLRHHVEDAVNRHAGFHAGAHAGISIIRLASKFRIVTSKRHQRGEMTAC